MSLLQNIFMVLNELAGLPEVEYRVGELILAFQTLENECTVVSGDRT